jgi:hypothetical protein
VQRDRDQDIEKVGVPIAVESFGHPFRKENAEILFSLIFPSMDRLLERSFIRS